MTSEPAMTSLPPLPEQLLHYDEVSRFVSIYQQVAERQTAQCPSLTAPPPRGSYLVTAPLNEAIYTMIPMDVSDPFYEDAALQEKLVRRHVMLMLNREATAGADSNTERVTLTGDKAKIEEQRTDNDGGATRTYSVVCGDKTVTARAVEAGGVNGDEVQVVDAVLVTLNEVTDAVGRHPQIPFDYMPTVTPGPPQ